MIKRRIAEICFVWPQYFFFRSRDFVKSASTRFFNNASVLGRLLLQQSTLKPALKLRGAPMHLASVVCIDSSDHERILKRFDTLFIKKS